MLHSKNFVGKEALSRRPIGGLLAITFAVLGGNSFAYEACEDALRGAKFFHARQPTLHQSNRVERLIEKTAPPLTKLEVWFKEMESALKAYQSGAPERMSRLKKAYLDAYVIKENEIPESYYQNQIRMAREQGYGDVKLSPKEKKEIARILIQDQRASLEEWLDYLTHKDADVYPLWAKYWAFTSLVKLSKFDPETGTFAKRSNGQVTPFPELNREAFSVALDDIVKDPKKEANFGKIYGQSFSSLQKKATNLIETGGRWVVFKKGSDHLPLVESLRGMGTGWCTAGESTAKAHLQGGDFHVYYSLDESGRATIPRIAIRMEERRIAEVRGVEKDQNLDAQIAQSGVLEAKLKEFGREADLYKKRSAHMRRLTEIEAVKKSGATLSREDLRFLYEIDEKIDGFGYRSDPRISEIRDGRNRRQDLAYIFAITEDRISMTKEEALRGNIVYHDGNLDLKTLASATGLRLPQFVRGYLDLSALLSADGLVLPKTVGGTLNLRSASSAKDAAFPEVVGGNVDLGSLRSGDGLSLPKTVGGALTFDSLKSAKGLTLPTSVGANLILRGLVSAEGLVLPKTVGGAVSLSSLTSAKGVTLPQFVGDDLDLNSLLSAEGLTLPETVLGGLFFKSLVSVEGLNLPKDFAGDFIIVSSIGSGDGLVLPPNFKGTVYFAKTNKAPPSSAPPLQFCEIAVTDFEYAGTFRSRNRLPPNRKAS